MEVIDYGSSFLIGTWPENQVRFWVESRTLIWDDTTALNEEYYQCGACKSENTFAPKELFHKDNYDFTPVFGRDFGAIFRRKAHANNGYKEVKAADAMWGGVMQKIRLPRQVRRLGTPQEIAQATHQGLPLVARTKLRQGSVHVIIEYPIKTMNVHVERAMFQVDTGPVAFPDLQGGHERSIDAITLAYVAFNAWDFAEFILETPTPVAKDTQGNEVAVHHYSRILELEAENELFAIARPADPTP